MKTSAWAGPIGRLACLFLCLLTAGCTNTLNRAIYREKPEKIDEFLNAGANVNQADDNGGTPLIYAAQFGDLALMKKLVARGAKIDSIDRRGNSALSFLASGETYKNDAVAYLLSLHARVDVVNNEGHAPLHLAAMRPCKPADAAQQVELLRLLVEAGSDPNSKPTGELPLHLAAFAGQPDAALDYLLTVTKEPHALTDKGYHALTEAARGDQHDAVLFFASHGFEPQTLGPALLPEPDGVTRFIEPTSPINARAFAAFGDYRLSQGNPADALVNYRRSEANYQAAVDGYRRVIAYNTGLLEESKDARTRKWISAVALSIVGTGLGASSGIGVVVVPGRSKDDNQDEFKDELERQQTELTVLLKEQSALKNKIAYVVNPPTPGPNGTPAAAVKDAKVK